MKRLILFVCLVAMVFGVQAATQYRDFTSAEGKTIRGEIKAYDARRKTVTIKRDNKKTSKVPIAVFSEADQTYILEWDASKGFLSGNLLKISCDDRQLKKRKENETEDIQYRGGDVVTDFIKTVTTFESIAYDIQFQNMNQSELQNIRMEYRIYYEQSEINWERKPEAMQKILSAEMVIPTLAGNSKVTVTTKPIEIHEDNINPIPMAGGDSRQGGKGKILGIRARLYMKMASGQEVMREFSSPEKLSEEKFPWKD